LLAINQATIDCSGYNSCLNSRSIQSDQKISCSGTSSCENIKAKGSISSHEIICDGSRSCKDSVIRSKEEYGFVDCKGDTSCFRSTIHATIIKCQGQDSCTNAALKGRKVLCQSKSSCKDTDIISEYIEINAMRAGYRSTIYAPQQVYGYGYFGLTQAIIDSDNSGEIMEVFMYGFMSGYGSTVICRENSKCILECKSSGCRELNYVCLNGANCVMKPQGCPTDNSVTRINGIDCPTYHTNIPNQGDIIKSLADPIYLQMIQEDNNDMDGIKIETSNTEIATNSVLDGDCLTHQECQHEQLTADSVHCFGQGGCFKSVIDGSKVDDISSNTALCYGDGSCAESTILKKHNVNCGGFNSCISNEILMDLKGHISCFGSNSCKTGFVEANTIHCGGKRSCIHNKMTIASNVKCGGQESCSKTHINSDENVLCQGQRSCKESEVIANNNVICGAMLSCSNSKINTNIVKVFGYYGARESQIKANVIEGYGMYSLYYAQIDSGVNGNMKVVANGYFSGYRATIICRKNSHCKLDCNGSNSCTELDYICLDGAKCDVTPVKCLDIVASDVVIDGIICPNVKKSVSEKEDQHLMEYMEEQQQMKYQMADNINDMRHYIERMNEYSEDEISDGHNNIRELLEDETDIGENRNLVVNEETKNFMKDSHNLGLRGIGLYLFLLLLIVVFSCVCILGICCIKNSTYEYPNEMYEPMLTKL